MGSLQVSITSAIDYFVTIVFFSPLLRLTILSHGNFNVWYIVDILSYFLGEKTRKHAREYYEMRKEFFTFVNYFEIML